MSSLTTADMVQDGVRPRVIAALDLDQFYVSVERLRNPRLIGKPVGIQQKALLATCSYEARKAGVTKLMSLKRARELCPELVVVNGEDLTHYRRVSTHVRRIVRDVVGAFETNGMDEVFFDLTDIITKHMHYNDLDHTQDLLSDAYPTAASNIHLSVNTITSIQLCNNHKIDCLLDPPLASHTHTQPYSHHDLSAADNHHTHGIQKEVPLDMRLASHILSYLRNLINVETGVGGGGPGVGLTSSAGIARSRSIAKLMAGTNKPDCQTVWAVPVTDDRRMTIQFLAHQPVRALNGFGREIVKKLCDSLLSQNVEQSDPQLLTVQQLITGLQPDPLHQFKSILGPRFGTSLFAIITADDHEPLRDTPLYPSTVSVEDSFASFRSEMTLDGVILEIKKLLWALLRRCEAELSTMPADAASDSSGRRWARWPARLRITLALDHRRTSRSVPMPIEFFEDQLSQSHKVQCLTNVLKPTILTIIRDKLVQDKYVIHVINVAAVDLSETPTLQNGPISAWFGVQSSRQKRARSASLDTSRTQSTSTSDDEVIMISKTCTPDITTLGDTDDDEASNTPHAQSGILRLSH